MLGRLGVEAKIEPSPNKVKDYDKIILPGVGKFDYGVEQLSSTGLGEAVVNFAYSGKPLLGICLGMHLLFEKSEEGEMDGLALLQGKLRKFSFENRKDYPVPHMGWNDVQFDKGLLGKGRASFYFVHSFYLPMESHFSTGHTEYGLKFSSVVEKDNIFGVQFHPEKSHRCGMELLKKFAVVTI